MQRILSAVMSVLVMVGLVAGVVWYHMVATAPVPEETSYGIDLPEIRRLAAEPGGRLPSRINARVIARSIVPRGAVIAGGGFGEHTMVRVAYQVVYPDRTVIIDAGTNRALHEEMGLEGPFYPERYTALQQALRAADTMVITHAHPDHIGGIAGSDHLESLLPGVLLNHRQSRNRALLSAVDFPLDRIADAKVISYDDYYPLAPGIVLIAAPGHTPGSQMVYVRRGDGEEYLFVGDVAWNMDNIRTPRDKPRLISRFMVGENTGNVRRQLRALHELHETHPDLHFVVSHDADQHQRYFEEGLLGNEFSL